MDMKRLVSRTLFFLAIVLVRNLEQGAERVGLVRTSEAVMMQSLTTACAGSSRSLRVKGSLSCLRLRHRSGTDDD